MLGSSPTAVKISYFSNFIQNIWRSEHVTKVTLRALEALNEWMV